MSHLNKKQKGFTLIELLVVISIIGLLSSIVLASLNVARQRAQIASAQQEGVQLQNALEIYYTDNGSYPPGVQGSPPFYRDEAQLEPLISQYISDSMPTFTKGISGATLYPMNYGGAGKYRYANKKSAKLAGWNYYCGNAGVNSAYAIYFGVLTSQKSIIDGKFPKFKNSSGGHYVSGDYTFYCVGEPPR